MDVTMMLCDAAQEVNGKLYILGGGWSTARGPGPFAMALAIKVEVPWNEANQPHQIRLQLVTADGPLVQFNGEDVKVEGNMEVGRPAGLKLGTSIDAPLAFGLGALPLETGAYRWEFYIDGTKESERSFQIVKEAAPAQPPA